MAIRTKVDLLNLLNRLFPWQPPAWRDLVDTIDRIHVQDYPAPDDWLHQEPGVLWEQPTANCRWMVDSRRKQILRAPDNTPPVFRYPRPTGNAAWQDPLTPLRVALTQQGYDPTEYVAVCNAAKANSRAVLTESLSGQTYHVTAGADLFDYFRLYLISVGAYYNPALSYVIDPAIHLPSLSGVVLDAPGITSAMHGDVFMIIAAFADVALHNDPLPTYTSVPEIGQDRSVQAAELDSWWNAIATEFAIT